jgi:hypothetical protein
MGNHKRSHSSNRRSNRKPSRSNAAPLLAPLPTPSTRIPIRYGEPFTLLENESKATFEYKTGTWIPYTMTIAECRLNHCQVKELPQKVNSMTRYEVRLPLGD